MAERKRHGRKLLIATIGVAAVSYVACGDSEVVANLIAPPPPEAGSDTGGSVNTGGGSNAGGSINTGGDVSGGGQAGNSGASGSNNIQDAAAEKAVFGFDVLVANLIAPPPPDAKGDGR